MSLLCRQGTSLAEIKKQEPCAMYPQILRNVIIDLVLLCQRVVSTPAYVQEGVRFLDDVATYVKES